MYFLLQLINHPFAFSDHTHTHRETMCIRGDFCIEEWWMATRTGDKGVSPSMESSQIRNWINTADTPVSQHSKVIMSFCHKPALVSAGDPMVFLWLAPQDALDFVCAYLPFPQRTRWRDDLRHRGQHQWIYPGALLQIHKKTGTLIHS